MVTIEEVAKHCGVSAMTVSRVINNRDNVKEETKQKVRRAIAELNYRPNLLAKGLVTGRTKTIAHVVVNISNLFHPRVIQGVEDACYEKGYNVILCNANNKHKETEYINIISDKYIDGFIFHHLNINSKQAYELENKGIKCVLIDNEKPLDICPNVITDNELGGYLAAKHLIELGHEKIGIIHGALQINEAIADKGYEETFQFNIWNKRLEGCLKAFREHGIAIKPEYMAEGRGEADFSIDSGYAAMQSILSRIDLPTAIYTQNDLMAIGALRAIMESGYGIPRDFSIIGHDGIDLCKSIYPQLTSIEQPRYQMGYLSAQLLIDQIESNRKKENIILKPSLAVRQTTARLGN